VRRDDDGSNPDYKSFEGHVYTPHGIVVVSSSWYDNKQRGLIFQHSYWCVVFRGREFARRELRFRQARGLAIIATRFAREVAEGKH
jgi:hypothetical protein